MCRQRRLPPMVFSWVRRSFWRLGVTILQVAANPYVTILGPPETASSRLNLTQAFNTLGDTVAPYVGGALILGTAVVADPNHPLSGAALNAFRIQQAANIKLPFMAIAAVVIVLALAIGLYRFPRIETTQDYRPGSLDISKDSIWHHPAPLPRRNCDLRVCGRGGFNRDFSGQVLQRSTDRRSAAGKGSEAGDALLGEHDGGGDLSVPL